MRTNTIVNIIIIFQICLIGFIFYQKTQKKVNVTKINKNSVERSEGLNLKYFFDLKKNDVSTWEHEYIKEAVTNTHNNDGLNESKDYSVQKDQKTFRIIALGDSLTYGVYLNTSENWTELLEQKLNEKKICKNIDKFEILNFGVSGYDPMYEVEKYRISGQKYAPDLIIWMLVDPIRFVEMQTPEINKCVEQEKKDLVECSKKVKISYFDIYKDYALEIMQRKNIDKIREYYQGHIFFVDYYNNHQNIINNFPNSTIFSEITSRKYLYKKYSESKLTFPDTHPNKLAHTIISEVVYKQLFALNQIPCEPISNP